jgi:hypothetical protein
MKKSIWFFILIIVFFSSCENKNEFDVVETHDSIKHFIEKQANDSVLLDVGLITAANFKGTYYDEVLDEDLIYVYNDVADHRLIFVNTQNKIRYEVDVTEFRKQGFETENIDVISLDTIIILTRHTNQLYFLNREGEIWKHIDLNEILPFTHDKYECGACVFAPMMFNNDDMLLTTYWEGNDSIIIDYNKSDWEKDYTYNKWHSNYLLRIDDVYDTTVSTVSNFQYYKAFFPQDSMSRIIPFSQYDFFDEHIYITSMHSDMVMKLDMNNFHVLDTFKVTSNYTNVGMDCIDLDSPDIQSESLLNTRNAGLIRSLRYDKYRENFYITLYAENPKPYTLDVKSRNWVLQKYDKAFNLLSEYYCDDNSFMPFLLFTKHAVLIQKNIYPYRDELNYGKYTMVYYEFE